MMQENTIAFTVFDKMEEDIKAVNCLSPNAKRAYKYFEVLARKHDKETIKLNFQSMSQVLQMSVDEAKAAFEEVLNQKYFMYKKKGIYTFGTSRMVL